MSGGRTLGPADGAWRRACFVYVGGDAWCRLDGRVRGSIDSVGEGEGNRRRHDHDALASILQRAGRYSSAVPSPSRIPTLDPVGACARQTPPRYRLRAMVMAMMDAIVAAAVLSAPKTPFAVCVTAGQNQAGATTPALRWTQCFCQSRV